MIRIEYEPILVEQAVRLAVVDDPAKERALHAEIDPLYGVTDSQRRDLAFSECFARAFRALELDRLVPMLIAERPVIVRLADRCRVCRSGRASAQSVELFVKRPGADGTPVRRTILVSVCPETLAHPQPALHMLRREMLHASDMLDERFGYNTADLDGLSRLQQPTRDRYRVLWDLYVESRLRHEGLVEAEAAGSIWPAFARTFCVAHREPPPELFEGLLLLASTTHTALFRAAADPARLPALAGEGRLEGIAGAARHPALPATVLMPLARDGVCP